MSWVAGQQSLIEMDCYRPSVRLLGLAASVAVFDRRRGRRRRFRLFFWLKLWAEKSRLLLGQPQPRKRWTGLTSPFDVQTGAANSAVRGYCENVEGLRRPRRRAYFISSALLWRFSFSMMWSLWVWMVLTLRMSFSAISRLVYPWPMS